MFRKKESLSLAGKGRDRIDIVATYDLATYDLATINEAGFKPL